MGFRSSTIIFTPNVNLACTSQGKQKNHYYKNYAIKLIKGMGDNTTHHYTNMVYIQSNNYNLGNSYAIKIYTKEIHKIIYGKIPFLLELFLGYLWVLLIKLIGFANEMLKPFRACH